MIETFVELTTKERKYLIRVPKIWEKKIEETRQKAYQRLIETTGDSFVVLEEFLQNTVYEDETPFWDFTFDSNGWIQKRKSPWFEKHSESSPEDTGDTSA